MKRLSRADLDCTRHCASGAHVSRGQLTALLTQGQSQGNTYKPEKADTDLYPRGRTIHFENCFRGIPKPFQGNSDLNFSLHSFRLYVSSHVAWLGFVALNLLVLLCAPPLSLISGKPDPRLQAFVCSSVAGFNAWFSRNESLLGNLLSVPASNSSLSMSLWSSSHKPT